MYHFLQTSLSLTCTRFTVNPAVTGSSPCFSQKPFRPISFDTVRLFQFFSALCDFFSNFFCRQRVLPSSFLIFCNKLKFQKAQRVPLSSFSALLDCFKNLIFRFFSKIFPNFFKYFLNVSKGSPLNFFDILQQTGFSKSRKGPPFNKLKKLRFFEP